MRIYPEHKIFKGSGFGFAGHIVRPYVSRSRFVATKRWEALGLRLVCNP